MADIIQNFIATNIDPQLGLSWIASSSLDRLSLFTDIRVWRWSNAAWCDSSYRNQSLIGNFMNWVGYVCELSIPSGSFCYQKGACSSICWKTAQVFWQRLWWDHIQIIQLKRSYLRIVNAKKCLFSIKFLTHVCVKTSKTLKTGPPPLRKIPWARNPIVTPVECLRHYEDMSLYGAWYHRDHQTIITSICTEWCVNWPVKGCCDTGTACQFCVNTGTLYIYSNTAMQIIMASAMWMKKMSVEL